MSDGTWRDRAPVWLKDDPTDRVWLWRIYALLAIYAPAGSVPSRMNADLREYLNETCEHRWDDPSDHERQCVWCHAVAAVPDGG